ncbi:hypothetical protein [Xanthobacter versatilis]|uniref:hypothetical protein n=1 Tax=Xanthobacter autotrophicus (strain ATCC BAA-1158 / Py2) TaxID=78245 RepID=UPI00372978E9
MISNLPTEMLNTFYDLARVEYASLDKQLRDKLQTIERQAAAAGALASGRTIMLACDAAADSLAVRCHMTWDQLFKAMSAYAIKIDRDTGSLLLSVLGSEATNSAITVRTIVERCAVFRSSLPDNAKQAGMDIIEKTLQYEVARMKAEVKLLVAASENQKPMSAAPSIAVTGDGNIVVTGDSNQVNALTQIDTAAAKSLTNALKATLEHLHTLTADGPVDVVEIKEIVEEALVEIQKPKPNKIKVTSAIKGIAETIKFVPALKAAYDIIKPAAATAGIYLP